MIYRIVILLVITTLFLSCHHVKENKHFEKLDSKKTGVTFSNKLKETPYMNIFNYMYFYNGGGVAVGDINNDKLPDLFFSSNQQKNRLYLNKGDFQFEDITDISGVGGDSGWTTGVSMADINGDGLLDLYVCQVGQLLNLQSRNLLYINKGADKNGIPVFVEQAKEYGLDISSYATQISFFDYDLDGDLDAYLLNHSVHNNGTFGRKELFKDKYHPTAGDRLFRNDDNIFTDQTHGSGIHSNALGYGLGIAHSDFDNNGYPDIYIANDFHEDDYFYLNNGDGSFTDIQKESFQHTSRFSMGVDIGDINNDGNMEIMTLDMLPEDPVILKSSAAEDLYDVYHYKLNYGYSHQFARNNLQYNLGTDPTTQKPQFSEIALFSGVAATDWSWSILFADFDHDGYNDIFISNGIMRRSNDLDYINYISNDTIQSRLKDLEIKEKDMALIAKMPEIKLPNYFYHNTGDFGFENVSEEWGFSEPSFSHGTAYADLDLDGDLDLVINNTDDPASIYRNLLMENGDGSQNYLKIRLKAKGKNTHGIGAKVKINMGDKFQVKELYPTRGFQSSVEPILHFGLGDVQQIDSLIVFWPNQQKSRLFDIETNQTLEIDQAQSKAVEPIKSSIEITSTWLEDVSSAVGIDFRHKENRFVEFNREVLIPHMLSEEGPPVIVSDFNGDGLEDVFFGNAKREVGGLFFQTKSGQYKTDERLMGIFEDEKVYEDVSGLALDVDADGDMDLLLGSGGNEFSGESEPRLQRLYLNDGRANFSRAESFPKIYQTNSDILAFDFDSDGDQDLLFSARAVPRNYGQLPDSYLLENKGSGLFEDVTNISAPFLKAFGFVQDMEILDIDGDGINEVLFAMEWDEIRVATCRDGKLTLLSGAQTGLTQSNGWWNVIIPGDFDLDGDQDFIAGNLGLNSKLSASEEHPLIMYYHDFDANGTKEQILCHYYKGEYRIFNTKDEVVSQLPSLKKRFTTNKAFAEASLSKIFDQKTLDEAKVFYAYELASCFFENDGSGQFSKHILPAECQFSTIENGLYTDINQNGTDEVLLTGNFYPVNIQMGRYDGSYGNVLQFQKQKIKTIPMEISGLRVSGECRDIQMTHNAKYGSLVIITRNDNMPVFYRLLDDPM